MKNIIFIAPPAAGKGTISERLKENLGYVHISTGDMLREAIKNKTSLGLIVESIMAKGEYVSDDIVISLIKDKLNSLDGKPFILDGFPRTINQALELDKNILNLNYQVIYLEISKKEALKRALGRITCSCGKTYNLNVTNLKPKVSGICDACGQALRQRDDDNEEAFIIRYNNYMEKTKPIMDYYIEKNLLVMLDATKDMEKLYNDIIEVIK